jgi:multimeric flavodoxin WrbA
MEMKKTIAIIGSSRRDGNTGKLIDCIAQPLNIEVVDLGLKHLSPFDYAHKNLNDDFLPILDHLLLHDNIIFASPVYWYAMSAQMKMFIDRISDVLAVDELKSRGRQLRGKRGFLVATSASTQLDKSFKDSFIKTFEYLGMIYGGFVHLDCNNEYDINICEADIITFTDKLNPRSEIVYG